MQTVVRAFFSAQSTLKQTNLNQDLPVTRPFLLIDSDTQVNNVKKLIWNAAGFFQDE